MKIFISWSGERSRLVAELFDKWVQCVLQAVDPWLSSKDIDRGSLWFSEITNQLSNTHNGIICLTKSNLNKPWILFESGALAKGLSSNRVYTFLIDLSANDVKDPLAQFNHTMPTRESIYQLVRTINKGLDGQALKESILSNVFDTYWPQFEKEFQIILKTTSEEEIAQERPKEDMLNEILLSVRGIDKRLRKVEDIEVLFNVSKANNNAAAKRQIEDLNLSVRAFNALKALRINNVNDLLALDTDKLDLIGFRSKEEIKNMIESLKLEQ